MRLAWRKSVAMALAGNPASSQALATALPARVLERVTVKEPDTPAQFRTLADPGHGYERTVERLELCSAERECLKIVVVSDQLTRYESTRTYTLQFGTYEPLPGDDRMRLNWTKKLSNFFEMWSGGAGGTAAQPWAAETLADAECEDVSLASAEGWSPVEDISTTFVDESDGYDGRTPLGKTRILGLEVPCRGSAHVPNDFRDEGAEWGVCV